MIIWHMLQSFQIGIWVFAIYRAMSLQLALGWILPGILFSLHSLQFLLIASEVGKRRGFSRGQSFILTILLGFSWWYPQKQNKGLQL